MSKAKIPENHKTWSVFAAERGWRKYNPNNPHDTLFLEYDSIWRRSERAWPTGKGRTLAIIDQPLWQNHPGYKDNIINIQTVKGSDPFHSLDKEDTSYHGSAVVSIAAGEIGVARNANIVYRAYAPWVSGNTLHNHFCVLKNLRAWVDAGNHVDAISTSLGWMNDAPWAKETNRIINWFEARNIPVFSVNSLTPFTFPCGPYGFCFYEQKEGVFFSKLAMKKEISFSALGKRVAVPIDNRALACWDSGQKKYLNSLYYREFAGGFSWAVPFVAGMFVAAREANPKLKKPEFVKILLSTRQNFRYLEGRSLPTVDVNGFMEGVRRTPSRITRPSGRCSL